MFRWDNKGRPYRMRTRHTGRLTHIHKRWSDRHRLVRCPTICTKVANTVKIARLIVVEDATTLVPGIPFHAWMLEFGKAYLASTVFVNGVKLLQRDEHVPVSAASGLFCSP